MDDIESERLASESYFAQLEDTERKILIDLNRQKSFYEQERNNNAAVLIQVKNQ